MRILYVTPSYPTDGKPHEGVFIQQQTDEIRSLGIDLDVLLCKQSLPRFVARRIQNYQHLANLRIRSPWDSFVTVTRYLHIPRYRCPGATLRSLSSRIERHVKLNGPYDIIHGSDLWPAGIAAARAASRLGIPYIQSLHTVDSDTVTARTQRNLAAEALNQAVFIGCCGSPLLHFVERLDQACLTRTEVIPYGIYPPEFSAGPNASTAFKFVTLSNLHPRKRIPLVLEALARISQLGYTGWSYTLLGGGKPLDRDAVQKRAETLGIAERCNFLPPRPHEEALKLLTTADTFVLVSVDEAFGLVYLEALAAGVPSIGVTGEGASDTIVDGENGFLIGRDDTESLAVALMFLLDADEHSINHLRSNARKTAERFTWSSHAQRYVGAYSAAIGNH